MNRSGQKRLKLNRLFSDYGMLIVLILLCLLFSVLTVSEHFPEGTEAAHKIISEFNIAPQKPIIVIAKQNADDSQFVQVLTSKLQEQGVKNITVLTGEPAAVRAGLDSLALSSELAWTIITTHAYRPVVSMMTANMAEASRIPIVSPRSYRWPTFLLTDNIRNVANQITVIAIIAIGMTMVIITAGIDLSVGSLIALSAVVTAWLVAAMGGGAASGSEMFIAGIGGILLCGAIGAFSGLMVTGFKVPPFIATLGMMQVAAGFAYIISEGKPIYQLPDSFVWLGRGVDPLLHIPVAVIMMLVLYVVAHFVMTRTTLGRYIYAVGGNAEAARLAGIRVNWILFTVYTLCGLLAGLGGIIMASQLKSGAPTYGLTYELYVIAAVVVGGTSLMGGEGKIFGTLIGAFIIAVIQNGMNLTNVESYTQKVVLGLVILGAVLLDRLKQRRIRFRKSEELETASTG